MATATRAPEHLRHYEAFAVPFDDRELSSIVAYEERIAGIADTIGMLDGIGTAETPSALFGSDGDRDLILGCLDSLSMWYEALDSLRTDLAPRSGAGHKYLREQCIEFFHALNLTRSHACRVAFGTAGPRPDVDSGHVTFFDIPGIELDGRIAAESR